MTQHEFLILSNLIENDLFFRKAFPFIEKDYFSEHDSKVVFEEIHTHATSFKTAPTKESLSISLENRNDLKQEVLESLQETIAKFKASDAKDFDWLVSETEKWCKDRAIFNALMESVDIVQGSNKKMSRTAIPEILSKALGVSFDVDIGHDYISNVDDRLQFYHTKEDKIPFDLEYLNKITKDGVCRKTLNVLIAPSGKGKSLVLCHLAAAYLSLGYNVLYITMEMADKRIAERIDANLLDIPIGDIADLPANMFLTSFKKATQKIQGKLIIKEFPTASAGSLHFKHLMDELKLKKGFTPDIVIVDYLNICTSTRFKNGDSANSYMYIKSIAEELRGIAVEKNIVLWSATQTNREGYANSDPDEKTVSESMGIVHTCDLLLALIVTDELDKMGQIMFKQHKNRYNDLSIHKRFVVGIDRPKMRLVDVAQPKLVNDNYTAVTKDDDDSTFKSSSSSKFNRKKSTDDWN